MDKGDVKILKYFIDLFFGLCISLTLFYALTNRLDDPLTWLIISAIFGVIYVLVRLGCNHWMEIAPVSKTNGSFFGKLERKDKYVVVIFIIMVVLIIALSTFDIL